MMNKIDCCLSGVEQSCAGNCLSIVNGQMVPESCSPTEPTTSWAIVPISDTEFVLQNANGLCASGATMKKCDPTDKAQLFSKGVVAGKFAVNGAFSLQSQGKCYSSEGGVGFQTCDPADYSQVFITRQHGANGVFLENTTGVCVPCSYLPGNCDDVAKVYCQDMLNILEPRCQTWLKAQPSSSQQAINKDVCARGANLPGFSSYCASSMVIVVIALVVAALLALLAYKVMTRTH